MVYLDIFGSMWVKSHTLMVRYNSTNHEREKYFDQLNF